MPSARPLVFVALAFTLTLGCGGTQKSANRESRSNTGGRSAKLVTRSGSVAEHTRAVTLRRKGSWSLTSDKVKDVAPLVAHAATKNDISQDLIFGIIWVESRFDPRAVSPVGAQGLMQLMPKTADYLADRIDWSGRHHSFNPGFNVAAGSYYIARLIDQFNGDEKSALAAYNAGPGQVRRWLKGSGLPKVSIEYSTMVQTARSFFANRVRSGRSIPGVDTHTPTVTDEDLDRLGLTILISGLSDKQFGLNRENDANPFD